MKTKQLIMAEIREAVERRFGTFSSEPKADCIRLGLFLGDIVCFLPNDSATDEDAWKQACEAVGKICGKGRCPRGKKIMEAFKPFIHAPATPAPPDQSGLDPSPLYGECIKLREQIIDMESRYEIATCGLNSANKKIHDLKKQLAEQTKRAEEAEHEVASLAGFIESRGLRDADEGKAEAAVEPTDEDIRLAIMAEWGIPLSEPLFLAHCHNLVRSMIARCRPPAICGPTDEEIEKYFDSLQGKEFDTHHRAITTVRWAIARFKPVMCGPTADEVWTAVNACRETPTCIAPTAASFIAWYASSVRPVAEVEKPLRKEIKQLNGALADESNVVMAQKDSLSAANARLAELEKCRPVCWTEEKMRTVVAAEIKKGGYAETARRVTEQRHIDGKPFFEDWCLETAIRTLADLIPKPISRGRGKSDKYMAALQRLIETYPKSFIELPELPKIVFDLLVFTDEFAWGPVSQGAVGVREVKRR